MIKHHLAQLNIAKLKYAIDDPALSEFVDNLEIINALADESPGFVWRLQTEKGDATDIDFFGPDYLVNMSVWRDMESLRQFVYHSGHIGIMSRRREWFERINQAYTVLWWIPKGTIPSVEEAGEKLELLRRSGPTVDAFSFKQTFAAAAVAV